VNQQLLAVLDASDAVVARFEYAGGRMPVAMVQGGAVYYLAQDQVGSLRAVYTALGAVVRTVEYDAWGVILDEDIAQGYEGLKVPFGFAGGLHDRDTGLVLFGLRNYDPETGRWTSRDPIGLAGGDTDLYAYCANDPVNAVDPSGLCGISAPAGTTLFGDSIGGEFLNGAADGLLQLVDQANPFGAIFQQYGLYNSDAPGMGAGRIAGQVGLAARDISTLGATRIASNALGMAARGSRATRGATAATEVVQRAMSRAELASTRATGLLRGGRTGEHYVSNAINSNAHRARMRLALPQTPELRVTMEVPAGALADPTRVLERYRMPGGGMERIGYGDIPVTILDVWEY